MILVELQVSIECIRNIITPYKEKLRALHKRFAAKIENESKAKMFANNRGVEKKLLYYFLSVCLLKKKKNELFVLFRKPQ